MLGVCLLQMLALGVVLALGLVVYRKTRAKGKESFLQADAPRDTVILHQLGPGIHVPSISPFVIKLETYLRAAGIPYVNKFGRKFGPKGKVPWIQYNDHVVGDSQHVMEFLSAIVGVDLSSRLSPQQAAIAHVVRRSAEEFLYWSLVLHRLQFDSSSLLYRQLRLPAPVIWYLRRVTSNRAHAHGIGRHSQQEVAKMTEDDLRSFSVLLGKTKFLFGDTKDDVTEADCALFGQLSELLWETPSCQVAEEVKHKYPNLEQFCCNMKQTFWPDWEDRLLSASATSASDVTTTADDATPGPSPLSRGDKDVDDVTTVPSTQKHLADGGVLRSRVNIKPT